MATNEFPFPQADDIDKILKVISVSDEKNLTNKAAMAIWLGDITDRQVQYYISACQYLGFITKDKTFTELGNGIRSLTESQQCIELARVIVSHEVFGTVYFQEKLLGAKFSREEIVELMKHYIELGTPEMFWRRSQTVIKWVEWINNTFNDSID